VVSLELRPNTVTAKADVVFPVAAVSEKSGFFMDWEGRWRGFEATLTSNALSDLRVLDALADALGAPIDLRGAEAARSELAHLSDWEGLREPRPNTPVGPVAGAAAGAGQAVLASWHQLIDQGSLQDGEHHLAATARAAVARISAATAAEIGVVAGQDLAVSSSAGTIILPVTIDEMPDRVVWLPTNSPGSAVRRTLAVGPGAVVSLAPAATDHKTGETR
jgi:NADH-quinone oxidoreductase subunit G